VKASWREVVALISSKTRWYSTVSLPTLTARMEEKATKATKATTRMTREPRRLALPRSPRRAAGRRRAAKSAK
jgi:hypothetical protein